MSEPDSPPTSGASAPEHRSASSEPAAPPRLAGVPRAARRAIVVGASSGMGAAIVRQLASEGFAVAAIARRADKLDELRAECEVAGLPGRVIVRAHDVADTAAARPLFEEHVRELGGLDLLVFAAGIMPSIGKDEYDTEKDLAILDVNVGGCVAWCNPAAALFHAQRSGTIVGISSIAGDRGRKGNPAYCTSKAAMNTYLEALRNRLSEVGVHVCTIKPGYVDTAMTQGMDGLFWLISPEEAARQILAAARNRVNVRYVPLRWNAVGLVLRLVPSFLFRRASI